MRIDLDRVALTFDDVLLEPQYSDIASRDEVSLATEFGPYILGAPILSAPMDTVTGVDMCRALALDCLGLGVLHRYMSITEQAACFHGWPMAAAIGATKDFEERARALVDAGCKILCIDVAHGHSSLVLRAIERTKRAFPGIFLIAGNVATASGFQALERAGASAVKVGIGGGSICKTREVSSCGVPQLHAVMECAAIKTTALLISDGGHRTSGDLVKSLAAGADLVMLGSMLAGTRESPGEIFVAGDGKQYKVYRGMSSPSAQMDFSGSFRSNEGISTTIPYKGSVVDVLKEILWGVRSGLSYSGARTIKELQEKAVFIRQSPAGQQESFTHILNKK